MGFAMEVLTVLSLYAATAVIAPTAAQSSAFKCNATGATCNGLVGYVPPNVTTLAHIKTLFGIKNLRSFLGANNLPLSTPSTQLVAANHTLNIPFQCLCHNGTGIPRNRRPLYSVVPGDDLDHIAAEIFGRLTTYQQIQAVNNISDANLIKVGQQLWIPLPCSCDELGGERVVHYGHVVEAGTTVAAIAQQYNTTEDTLLALNGLASSKRLLAGAVLDVPLKACTSMVENSSLDYPLLVSSDTYAFTAGNCVICKCDAANNWTLQCEPSQVKSSLWTTCPSMQCEGAESLYIGNATILSRNQTSCAYAGYNNQTIFTTIASESTYPVFMNNAPSLSLQGWSWSNLFIYIHLAVLCSHFIN